jgi:hypothetical protein
VGYDAGKKMKGHKINALVDSEGLPMRVVVHSAAIQDRDGAGLVLDKIRRCFPWLEFIWVDGGYNAGQVEAAVAVVPVLRMEIVKRSDDTNSRPSPGCTRTTRLPRKRPLRHRNRAAKFDRYQTLCATNPRSAALHFLDDWMALALLRTSILHPARRPNLKPKFTRLHFRLLVACIASCPQCSER